MGLSQHSDTQLLTYPGLRKLLAPMLGRHKFEIVSVLREDKLDSSCPIHHHSNRTLPQPTLGWRVVVGKSIRRTGLEVKSTEQIKRTWCKVEW